MKTTHLPLTLAIAATLALSGCDRLPLPGIKDAVSAASGQGMALEQDVRGELTASSPVNYNDGSRHQLHTITLQAGQAVELVLDGPLNGRLGVFRGSQPVANSGGRFSAGMDEHGGEPAGPVALPFRAGEAGQYTIAVSGADAAAYGPYRLRANPITAYDGKPVAAGGHAVDWLVSDEQSYPLQVSQAGLYRITLESTVFDPMLRLTGDNVDEQNDDDGRGTNSLLATWLEPGSYTARVSSVDGRKGAFRLAVSSMPLQEGTVVRNGTTLPHNRRVNALLAGSQPAARDFQLVLAQRARVVLEARSGDFDTVLELSGNGVEASDDDGGSGTDSRLELNLGPGTYRVSVRSLNGLPGSFTIEANLATTPAPASTAAQAIEAAARMN